MVERAFGTLKQHFHFYRSRYVEIRKVVAEFNLIAMVFNVKKSVKLMS